jgi:hypothetical protein
VSITVQRKDFKRVVLHDEDPDLSYLKHPDGPLDRLRRAEAQLMGRPTDGDTTPLQEDAEFTLELQADEADEERLAAYERGEFHFVGLRARITLFIPFGNDKIMQDIQSPGLWGVESDSTEEYLSEVFNDECEVLIHMLTELGVAVAS